MSKLNSESLPVEFFQNKPLMKIFLSILENPKSVKEIYHDSEINLSSTYRILKKLEQEGLVKKSGIISNDGKKQFLYNR